MIEAGGGFVEQQKLWRNRQRARQFDSLLDAERQFANQTIRNPLQSALGDQRVGERGDFALRPARLRRRKGVGDEAAARENMSADAHVLAHRHGGEQREVLKRAGDAERGDLMAANARKRRPSKQISPALGS